MTFPSDYLPAELQGLTTGLKLFTPPYLDIPITGITALVTHASRPDYFYALVDEGYGSSDVSEDFPLHYYIMQMSALNFENDIATYPENTIFLTDPGNFVMWTSIWDRKTLAIQVAYASPDSWSSLVETRVVTGRDFSPQGMVVLDDNCAIVAEKWGPSIFALDPSTGYVKSTQIP